MEADLQGCWKKMMAQAIHQAAVMTIDSGRMKKINKSVARVCAGQVSRQQKRCAFHKLSTEIEQTKEQLVAAGIQKKAHQNVNSIWSIIWNIRLHSFLLHVLLHPDAFKVVNNHCIICIRVAPLWPKTRPWQDQNVRVWHSQRRLHLANLGDAHIVLAQVIVQRHCHHSWPCSVKYLLSPVQVMIKGTSCCSFLVDGADDELQNTLDCRVARCCCLRAS